ncbi:autotransporter assembly complex protein TamA [Pontiella agarivorans]|uniref:autotransporter assembly complex protein TamA n=1 Tax=Pontiella agarivorans TaxID=3038953 RepID=UPI002AD45A56|nr:BamA/TamA family outer membrane protein [Pontiella agarivorans]
MKIRGAENNALKKSIKESCRTYTMRKRPPSTVGQLRRRMEKDVPLIETLLEARGFYDGTVQMDLDAERDPMRVTIRVEQGAQYRFGRVDLLFSGEGDEQLEKIKPLIRRRHKAVAATVFTEQQRVLDLMARRGYPFAELSRRSVTVDRERKRVNLVLEFNPGTLSFFGKSTVEGLEQIPDKYVYRQIPWNPGRRYDAQLVHDFETRLLGTGQFGSARVVPQRSAEGTNAIPLNIKLNERAMRTIRLGVNYSDIGPGGRIFWSHRNIFGGGERFETSLSGSPIEVKWDGKLTRAGFLDGRQTLVLDMAAGYEDPDAYRAKNGKISGMVLRDFTPNIQAGLGSGYRYSLVDQFGEQDRFSYVFFPVQGVLDYRDDRLNPLKGFQLFGRTAWYEDTTGNDSYLKSEIEAREYILFWERIHLSLALRGKIGSIDGTDVSAVPADERFYAGGGGSIRGYEYQQVGPRVDGTPTGGNRVVEFSTELRMQPGNRLGYALFLDGGTVFTDLLDWGTDRSLRYGAGLGLRWFTGIGPLRADLAFPLNPDDEQVERLQFYISLGQAF